MMVKKLLLLTTGGTIEKSYSESEGLLSNRESVLREKLLSRLRLPATRIEITEIMAKDSLDMDDNDREIIFVKIKDHMHDFDGIVVLHGTDTIHKSMKHCEVREPAPKCPVVFTGAMKPAGFDDSDALQNFTEAIFAAQVSEPGYYLSFHGQLFKGSNVVKNREARTFEYAK